MAIKVNDSFDNKSEQKNTRKSKTLFDVEVAENVYYGVKKLLENDEFNIFETRSKYVKEKRIKKLVADIDKLIKLNIRGKEQTTKLKVEIANVRQNNKKAIGMIKEKLG